jgi:beta-N-acetylhexosaminidase
VRLDEAVARRFLLSFRGTEPPPDLLERVARGPLGGVTLYRSLNVSDAEQVAALTSRLQEASQEQLLIGADQEGGQLVALGDDTTPFPGNLALGATGSAEFAREVGECLGRELAAMGVNIDYAPVCDVNSNPNNPVVGARSFGEDPTRVGELAAALVAGLQSVGVAATAKHFPGHGDTSTDSHYGIPVLAHDLAALEQSELPPFLAAIGAGARLVMIGHLAVPTLTGREDQVATVSRAIVTGLLRERLGYTGVTVSDALDMAALAQGPGHLNEVVAAAAAGVDLLLFGPRGHDADSLMDGLALAVRRGLVSEAEMDASAERVMALKAWVGAAPARPPLAVVGCHEHARVAARVAEESITLVRDESHLLPLAPSAEQRVVLVLPGLANLTPADTSAYVRHTLAEHVTRYAPRALTLKVAAEPSADEIESTTARIMDDDLVVVATANAYARPAQARLVLALLERTSRVIVVALRMPYDLQAFPSLGTYLCSYSAHAPSMRAVADVLFGTRAASGRLPVSIAGLFEVGYRASGYS